jgi:hypothetical protein
MVGHREPAPGLQRPPSGLEGLLVGGGTGGNPLLRRDDVGASADRQQYQGQRYHQRQAEQQPTAVMGGQAQPSPLVVEVVAHEPTPLKLDPASEPYATSP